MQMERSRIPKRKWRYSCSLLLGVAIAITFSLIFFPFRKFAKQKVSFVTTLQKFEANPSICSIGYLQQIALSNWLEFADEVIVLVDDAIFCSELKKFSKRIVCWQHKCLNVHYDKPAMNCLFLLAEWLSSNSVIMYSNPDVIYEGIDLTLELLFRHFAKFVAAGGRIDIDSIDMCHVQGYLQPRELLLLREEKGRKHEKWALDYFLYVKGSLPASSMPPFIIGNWRWDNWLLDEIIRFDYAPAVDVTDTIVALHLEDTTVSLSNRSAAKYNNDLWYAAMGWARPDPFPAGLGHLSFAPYYTEVEDGGLRLTLNHSALTVSSPFVQRIT